MADPKNLEEVRCILEKHKKRIIEKYQAEGVGIGKQEPNGENYVIVVYLQTGLNMPKESVLFENVPLKFEITGRFQL